VTPKTKGPRKEGRPAARKAAAAEAESHAPFSVFFFFPFPERD